MAEIAHAYVQLIPSFRGAKATINRELTALGSAGGKVFSGNFSQGIRSGSLQAAAALSTSLKKGVADARAALSTAKKNVADLGKQLTSANGSVEKSAARLAAAEAKLAADRKILANNTKQVELAERRLQAAQASGKANQIAAAEHQLLAARNKQASTAAKVQASEAKLTLAQSEHQRSLSKLTNLENEYSSASNQASGAAQKLSQAQAELKKHTDAAATATSGLLNKLKQVDFSAIGNSLSSVGRKMTTHITAPLVGFGGLVLKNAGDFEQGMNRVKALTDATGAEFNKLNKQARKLGADTIYSASDAANAMGFLAMAGFKTNQIYDSMPSVLNLAAAAQLDIGRAADITSNIVTGYGLSIEELGHANDVLVKAFTSANVDLNMLGESFKYAGPVARAAGMSFEDAAASIALLGNAGIQGSMAGTTLRGAMSRLLNPTKQTSKILDRLGVSVKNSDGSMRQFVDIIGDLSAAGADVSDIMEIFGDRAGPGIQSLLDQGTPAIRRLSEALKESGGTADRVAKTQMQGFKGSMEELSSAFEELTLALADSGLLEEATNFVKKLTEGLNKLSQVSPGTLKWITRLTLGIGLMGPTLWGLGKIISITTSTFRGLNTGLKIIKKAFKALPAGITKPITKLGSFVTKIFSARSALTLLRGALTAVRVAFTFLTGPIGIAIAAISLIAYGLYEAYQNCEWFRETVDNTWARIKEGAWQVWEKLSETWETIKTKFWEVWETIRTKAEEIWEDIKQDASDIKKDFDEKTRGIREAWNKMCTAISKIWEQYIEPIVAKVAPSMENIRNIIETTMMGIGQIISGTMQFIGGLFGLGLNTILFLFQFFAAILSGDWEGTWQAVKDYFYNTMGSLGDIAGGAWTTICGLFNVSAAWVKEMVREAWENIKTKTIEMATSLWQTVKDAWENVKTTVSNGATNVVNYVKELPGRIRAGLGDLKDYLFDSGSALINGFISGIKNKFNSAVQTVKDGLKRIRDYFPFSPAKEGPFSGRGWVEYSGATVFPAFAEGMRSGLFEGVNAVDEFMGLTEKAINSSLIFSPAIAAPNPARLSAKNRFIANEPAPLPSPNQQLDGLKIEGRLEIGGDGLARIVDGRIVGALGQQSRRLNMLGVR